MLCRNFVINDRRTSVRMEAEFWKALEEVARRRRMTVAALVSEVDRGRDGSPLTSALRVMAVRYFRETLNGSDATETSLSNVVLRTTFPLAMSS